MLEHSSKCAFISPLPQQDFKSGSIYAVTLEWAGMMMPQSKALLDSLIAPQAIENTFYHLKKDNETQRFPVPKFRITKEHHLRAQFNSNQPIEFSKPSPDQTFSILFQSAGFLHIENSSAARYHKEFVRRAGNLEIASTYLQKPPYLGLLNLLSNNRNESLSGWIINSPVKRRALSHLHLLEALGSQVPSDTKTYFNTISDLLPEEAVELLEKELLERGFLLKCQACSFSAWYPVDHVGQTFECYRCFQSQIFHSNPLWLYKLPEVLFQGLEGNMEVPLLALNYLKNMCNGHFEWMYDSDVYYLSGTTEHYKNIDILCLSNGGLYIGEAKSSDKIDVAQFSFYEELCKKLSIDGVVFATSKPKWGESTIRLIDKLRSNYDGEICVLTHNELYSTK
ncbi:MAG TPA: hypothetical protein VIW80_03660 [Pyrinomonadaceae bacterium]